MTGAADFTRAGYRALLNALRDRGYTVTDFAGARRDAAHLILRHDIDFAPDLAVPVAEVEAGLGMKAVYFMQLKTPFYAAHDPAARAAMARLLELGHEIGLHFDAAAGNAALPALDSRAREECARLEDLSGAPVRMISFHRPAKALLGLESDIGGRPHTYQPRFFKQMGYASDSRGLWRFGHPLENEAVAEGRALQLLTHPIWWANDDAGDREGALNRLVERLGTRIKPAIADVVTGYDADSGTIVS